MVERVNRSVWIRLMGTAYGAQASRLHNIHSVLLDRITGFTGLASLFNPVNPVILSKKMAGEMPALHNAYATSESHILRIFVCGNTFWRGAQ